ncbi:MAG: hypothetical protein GY785_14150 [Gammaproteobacteria bacterium]|nr:hypothetical protein [Gammaproteobacteria bacterium]
MSINHKKSESPVDRLKSESARQRWELFHRAIAHAKESNNASLLEADTESADMGSGSVVLSIIQ